MIEFYQKFLLALILLWLPTNVIAAGELTGMRRVDIFVKDLNADTQELGLSAAQLKAQVLVFLRTKLPGVVVTESASEFIVVMVDLNGSRLEGGIKIGYYGVVQVAVYRSVVITATGKASIAQVWQDGTIITGPSNRASIKVRDTLETILTQVAAHWYRDNP